MDESLFTAQGALAAYLEDLEQLADELVDQMAEEELLAQSADEHQSVLLARLMPRPPSLLLDRTEVRREVQVAGSCIEFRVPFEGAGALFEYAPSNRSQTPPRGRISGVLVATFPIGERTATTIAKEFAEAVEQIEKWLGYVREDLSEFEPVLSERLKNRIDARQARVRHERQVADDLSGRLSSESQ